MKNGLVTYPTITIVVVMVEVIVVVIILIHGVTIHRL